MDWEYLTGTLIRWLHVLSGIIWVGTLYSLVLIQGPALAALDPPVRKSLLLGIMPRALWWLRWAAMTTLILGTGLFTWEYHRIDAGFGTNANLSVQGVITDRALFTMTGIGLAITLWFMAWFLVWPPWTHVLRKLAGGEPPPTDLLARVKRRSRFAFIISGPLILFMVAPQNYLDDYSLLSVCSIAGVGVLVQALLLLLAGRLSFPDEPV